MGTGRGQHGINHGNLRRLNRRHPKKIAKNATGPKIPASPPPSTQTRKRPKVRDLFRFYKASDDT